MNDIILAAHKNSDQIDSWHVQLLSWQKIYHKSHYDDEDINFLDVKLIIEDGKIIFDIFKKSTNSDRNYLNFNSNYLIYHKKVIIDQFDRILFLSHLKFHERNIHQLIKTLTVVTQWIIYWIIYNFRYH